MVSGYNNYINIVIYFHKQELIHICVASNIATQATIKAKNNK